MIVARFKATHANVKTEGVIQWDYGRLLRIEGLELPDYVAIDIGVKGSNTVIRVLGRTVDGGKVADIPNELMEQPEDLVAYVFIITETEGKTVKTVFIPMTPRAKPNETEFVQPDAQSSFDKAVVAVNEAADRAKTAASDAKGSAEQAKESHDATAKIADAFTGTAKSAVDIVNSAGAAQKKYKPSAKRAQKSFLRSMRRGKRTRQRLSKPGMMPLTASARPGKKP